MQYIHTCYRGARMYDSGAEYLSNGGDISSQDFAFAPSSGCSNTLMMLGSSIPVGTSLSLPLVLSGGLRLGRLEPFGSCAARTVIVKHKAWS